MNLSNFSEIILTVMAALIALTVHEFSHGYAAYKLGDDTARNLGRLSLNPIKHIDPVGAICMIFFHIGWAKPVPINARNFRKPKRDFAITAFAGPVSNVIMAFFSAALYLAFRKIFIIASVEGYSELVINIFYNTTLFFSIFHTINIGLGVFNLIPIPPFDGSRILNVILPTRIYFGIMKYEKYIYWGVVAWLLLGNYVYVGLMSIPFIAGSEILSFVVRIFSLSGMLGDAISFLSGCMVRIWSIIPFLK